MRHTAVERLSLSALALVALSVVGFVLVVRAGQTAAPSVPAPDAFARQCESCHERAELKEQLLRDRSPQRRLELEKFLEDHGDATAEEDREILDELSGQPLSSVGLSRRKER
jgi:hypothetical protein